MPMKNYVPSHIALTLFFVLVIAGIGVIYPISTLLKEREQSQQILQDTILAIRHKLPAPSDPDLSKKMPNQISKNLRYEMRYYPLRDAYKYTFIQKYSYNANGQVVGESDFPEPLERRSIWWKVIDGEWQCYAGVKKHIRGQLCNEESIIQGITVTEHNNAWHTGNCNRITLWLRTLNLAYDTHIYYLTNLLEKDAHVRINSGGKDVLLVLTSTQPNTVWHIAYTPDTRIQAVIWRAEGQQNTIYGLPSGIQVFDYLSLPEMCHNELAKKSDDILARNMAGVLEPTIKWHRIDNQSETPLEIGEQANQQWQTASTVMTGPSKMTDVLTVEVESSPYPDATQQPQTEQ